MRVFFSTWLFQYCSVSFHLLLCGRWVSVVVSQADCTVSSDNGTEITGVLLTLAEILASQVHVWKRTPLSFSSLLLINVTHSHLVGDEKWGKMCERSWNRYRRGKLHLELSVSSALAFKFGERGTRVLPITGLGLLNKLQFFLGWCNSSVAVNSLWESQAVSTAR